jgi:hypothetical protein
MTLQPVQFGTLECQPKNVYQGGEDPMAGDDGRVKETEGLTRILLYVIMA